MRLATATRTLIGLLLAAMLAAPAGAATWRLVLKPEARLPVGPVRLGDVVQRNVPEAVAGLVLAGPGAAGSTIVLDRRSILRELVVAGLAEGVACSGADACRVRFSGRAIAAGAVVERLRAVLEGRLPVAAPGAPASRLEIDLPDADLRADGDWSLEVGGRDVLEPGRNLVPIAVVDGPRRTRLTATATCHVFGETAAALHPVREDSPLDAGMFRWEWRDLAEVDQGLAVGRDALLGASAACDIDGGQPLRRSQLKETPLVRRGEPVELEISRGVVAVTVLATSRQDGRMGQTITVRNELTGKLVTGRIVGPGHVLWSR